MVRSLALIFVCGIVLAIAPQSALAQRQICCMSQAMSFNEQLAAGQHFLKGKVVRVLESDHDCEIEVTDVIRSTDPKVKAGERIRATLLQRFDSSEKDPFHIPTTPGTPLFVVGYGDTTLEQAEVMGEADASLTVYLMSTAERLKSVKSPEYRKRLFLEFICDPDNVIALDALAELFADGPSAVNGLRTEIPIDAVRQRFSDPNTPSKINEFYAYLLGVCGNADDARLLEKKLLILDSEFRMGIETVIIGYVMLAREDGLKVVNESKILATTATTSEGKTVPLPFSELYAVQQAMRFFLENPNDSVSREQVLQSMYLLLERKELADLVIGDLIKAKDWTIQDRLVAMLDEEQFKMPATRRAIVRYLFYSSRQMGQPDDNGLVVRPTHSIKAAEILQKLEATDAKLVQDARRFLMPEESPGIPSATK